MNTPNPTPQYWIGVASKNHVATVTELGICQFCHGKPGPAKRLKKGDFVIYYSPKVTMNGAESYQKFTAIGSVQDSSPYQVEQAPGFMPFRRNIKYFEFTHADIKPLIQSLAFIQNKQSWGYVFRYGFFAIDEESFKAIAHAMLGYIPQPSDTQTTFL